MHYYATGYCAVWCNEGKGRYCNYNCVAKCGTCTAFMSCPGNPINGYPCQNWDAFLPQPTTPPIVNCIGAWSQYGPCSATCGKGLQTRNYSITTSAANGGLKCEETNGQTESKDCELTACPLPGSSQNQPTYPYPPKTNDCDPNYQDQWGTCSTYQLEKWCSPNGGTGDNWLPEWGAELNNAWKCPQCGCVSENNEYMEVFHALSL